MLGVLIVALVCGGISIIFIIMEINQSFNNLCKTWETLHGIGKIQMLWLWPLAIMPVLLDVGITLGVVWLFSMNGGMVGMMTAMMCSALVSGYLFIRRKRHSRIR
ncbi:MAG: hypothetical protein A2268_02980 [Candidatus Raymondbacteria bacterium RifOxyA12_full_50_37]|uniref:Uncharacterized protein n=1 Tax=Candidatus Raymondbacteria bacterium RIFOXYD12_FULL_49_13 TaxID=1817890 RepID=A0A1F7F902_UNCRA|nr:MAG: hypothetical protein A2248_17085 [Candidatus Raymondbacteria bacterium RIFOXYA2_FULL_49_16]OGJ90741.1 MAG: hypothetical protein A2268_02980 [Candidatus Raymondbacteria bacterium RifOxyA12_full_50_37]OGJ91718.1 MAG: hypothetical protein A2350_00390 [Candidatus Raymondbacteria bacterium RifOxyB12_full_50_8]OGJ98378.1 MAG: hypothetical protein A2453_08990 [Candidatus Raymondbacteria bacterium RIFOXYC2_FULL_50_21]OGK03103.1 MAG: hypothetical protein A2519_06820 [Candidatus Raymondbacteria b